MKRFISSKILSWMLIILFVIHLNSCNLTRVSSVKDNKNKESESAGMSLKKLDVFINLVEPSQSGELHNEILEIFSKKHTFKPASLSKEEFVKDFTESANKALKNRGIDPLVSNEYVESVINESINLKKKGIYDFFQPQKVQDTGKILSYFEQKGKITQNDIEETKKLINLVRNNKPSLKRADSYIAMQKKVGEKQSKKVIRATDVAISSAMFWDNVEENDSEFVSGMARDVGWILADLLGALIGGVVGAAIVSIVFLIMWWLLENK